MPPCRINTLDVIHIVVWLWENKPVDINGLPSQLRWNIDVCNLQGYEIEPKTIDLVGYTYHIGDHPCACKYHCTRTITSILNIVPLKTLRPLLTWNVLTQIRNQISHGLWYLANIAAELRSSCLLFLNRVYAAPLCLPVQSNHLVCMAILYRGHWYVSSNL